MAERAILKVGYWSVYDNSELWFLQKNDLNPYCSRGSAIRNSEPHYYYGRTSKSVIGLRVSIHWKIRVLKFTFVCCVFWEILVNFWQAGPAMMLSNASWRFCLLIFRSSVRFIFLLCLFYRFLGTSTTQVRRWNVKKRIGSSVSSLLTSLHGEVPIE